MLEEFQSELKKLEPLASPILLCKLFIIQHSVLNDITTFCESKKKKKTHNDFPLLHLHCGPNLDWDGVDIRNLVMYAYIKKKKDE